MYLKEKVNSTFYEQDVVAACRREVYIDFPERVASPTLSFEVRSFRVCRLPDPMSSEPCNRVRGVALVLLRKSNDFLGVTFNLEVFHSGFFSPN